MKQTRSFDHAPGSVTAARRFATDALQGTPLDTIEVVALLVSELATNCVKHTRRGFELMIARSAREIRVEATDRGGGEPAMRSPGPTDPTGRGLRIVDMLAGAWGVEHRAKHATTVWFTIAVEEGAEERAEAVTAPRPKRRAAARRSRRPRPGAAGSRGGVESHRGCSSSQLGHDHRRMGRRAAAPVRLRRHQHLAHSA